MEKLTAQDLKELKHGDTVYQLKSTQEIKLHFVGKMPNNENYLIFCNGEHLEYLYINEKTNSFKHDWYSSKLSIKELGIIIISNIEKKIEELMKDKENVKDIYLKD